MIISPGRTKTFYCDEPQPSVRHADIASIVLFRARVVRVLRSRVIGFPSPTRPPRPPRARAATKFHIATKYLPTISVSSGEESEKTARRAGRARSRVRARRPRATDAAGPRAEPSRARGWRDAGGGRLHAARKRSISHAQPGEPRRIVRVLGRVGHQRAATWHERLTEHAPARIRHQRRAEVAKCRRVARGLGGGERCAREGGDDRDVVVTSRARAERSERAHL